MKHVQLRLRDHPVVWTVQIPDEAVGTDVIRFEGDDRIYLRRSNEVYEAAACLVMPKRQSVRPADLEKGCYWVRSVNPAYPAIFMAEWCDDRWAYFGVSGTDTRESLEVLSKRLMPPDGGSWT